MFRIRSKFLFSSYSFPKMLLPWRKYKMLARLGQWQCWEAYLLDHWRWVTLSSVNTWMDNPPQATSHARQWTIPPRDLQSPLQNEAASKMEPKKMAQKLSILAIRWLGTAKMRGCWKESASKPHFFLVLFAVLSHPGVQEIIFADRQQAHSFLQQK